MAGAVLAGLLAGWWAFGRDAFPGVTWADVSRGDLVLAVEINGTLQAVNSTPVVPPQLAAVFDFKISMMAPEGADVAAGAPVLGFDTGDLDHKLLEKKAESESAGKRIEKKEKDAEIERQNDELRLAEATSRWRKASLELDVPPELVKSQQLRESKLNAEDARREMEFLKAKLAGAARANEVTLSALRAQKDAADRRVNEILASIEAMTLKAPRAGTVVYSADWKGSKKKVGDSAWRGERILEIPDLSAMKAEGEVDESDAGKIAVGEKVRLRLEAHPDVEFAGKVASIWSAVQTQSARSPVKIVKLAIDLDVTDSRKMRPGMRFRGTVETGRIARAILVPKDAVFPTEAGPVAYRRTALGYATRRLTIGAQNDSSVEVRAGLDPGDRVALRDLDAAAGSDR
jgi:multidrug efflux pump subunit AcrA (membrane-fusion protein)